MRTRLFVSLLALASGWTSAQTPSAPVAPALPPTVHEVPQPAQPSATTDPAKLADFEKRFAQGQALEQAGKLVEARAIFDGIIAESPEAKGSLREAGFISVQLNELPKADDYFSKLHALVPDYPGAIESLIQINQTLKRDVKVEMLLGEYHDLYAAGKVPKPYFVRERIDLGQGQQFVMTEFFDYHQEPHTVWMAEVFDTGGQVKRRLLLNYDPAGTKDLQAKDPKFAHAEQFLLIEDVLQGDRVTQVNAYFQMFSLPEYTKARNTMLAILGGAYKPVYSQTVTSPAQ